MPVKPESKFWKQLKAGTADLDVLWTRIESWASPGVPDLFGVYRGHSFWLELKICKLKTVKHIDLSPQQVLWQVQHSQAGASVWNLVRQTETDQVKLFDGRRAMLLGRKTKNDEEMKPDWKAEKKVDWKGLMDYIYDHGRVIS
tara:strand:+ start:359 stop:787 length:429 start_codon:yes stop_codon:yes gene_type:complete